MRNPLRSIAFGTELETTLGTTPESVGVLLISRSVHEDLGGKPH
jgi:hypothetical protein